MSKPTAFTPFGISTIAPASPRNSSILLKDSGFKNPGVSIIVMCFPLTIPVAEAVAVVTDFNDHLDTKTFLFRKKFPAQLFPLPMTPVKMTEQLANIKTLT